MSSRSLYGQEPSSIAHYNFAHLKINRGNLTPRSPLGSLPADADRILRHFDTMIELSTEELADRLRSPLPKPHWDPSLARSKHEKRRLLLHLARLGLVSFRTSVKAKAGMFFVRKRGSTQTDAIRLVIDARQACACHRRPPKVQLGSARAMCDLDLSDEVLRDLGGCGGLPPYSVKAGGRRCG